MPLCAEPFSGRIGAVVADALYRSGQPGAAVVVLTIAFSSTAFSIAAPRVGARIDAGLAWFSGWVGKILTFVVLRVPEKIRPRCL